jgi:hypothetical protein
LFGQASLVFDAGAYPATSLVCRSSCEAALFIFLYSERILDPDTGNPTGSIRLFSAATGKRGREPGFQDLICDLCKRGILDSSQQAALWRIKERGDAIAHLEANYRRSMLPNDLQKGKEPLWPNRQEAFEDLEDTLGILTTIAQTVDAHPEKMGPHGK